MTDEELIALLRDWNEYDEGKINDTREAAATRIEELANERDAAEHSARMRKAFIEEARDERDRAETRVEELERACTEWAEVSQRNYQCAKAYFEALQLIAAPTYGIQSIMEDYEIDSIPYLEAALSYYYKLVTSYQATARSAIAGVEGVEDDEEFG